MTATIKNIVIGSLVGVGLALSATHGAQANSLRFASEASRNDTQYAGAQKFNELLDEKTGGELDLKIFTDSTLGNGQAAITGTRGSTIDMLVTGSSNFSGLVPLIGMLDIPFLFENTDHAYRTLDGEVGQELLDKLNDVGLQGLAYWDNGWRQITNSAHPVHTPDDVKGLKIRTTGAPVHIEAFKLLGANPVPMPIGELYTALEMGTVDAQEHPLGVFVSAKLYEVQDYLTLSYHAYSPLIVAMNKSKFDALPEDQQEALIEAAREAGDYQRELNNQAIAEEVEFLRGEGLDIVESIDQAPFVEATIGVRETFVDQFGGASELQQIDALRVDD
ncbi:TRAP transporter substrate-binding protein [uncultured Martelella sp.]|uniref:TRAP transporter substrate-binding protein n=1 Tax=uncultured Martelella sp. TaxID=392331 RepID=UPI0029C74C0A|nr:TRAP transporter substrate-binding protein [uncultured Martelella sp.]